MLVHPILTHITNDSFKQRIGLSYTNENVSLKLLNSITHPVLNDFRKEIKSREPIIEYTKIYTLIEYTDTYKLSIKEIANITNIRLFQTDIALFLLKHSNFKDMQLSIKELNNLYNISFEFTEHAYINANPLKEESMDTMYINWNDRKWKLE